MLHYLFFCEIYIACYATKSKINMRKRHHMKLDILSMILGGAL